MERRHAPDAVDATGRLIAGLLLPSVRPLLRRRPLPSVSAGNRDRERERDADRGFQPPPRRITSANNLCRERSPGGVAAHGRSDR